MADVKWIKVTTDIFDDEKILLIESMPERDSLIVIWFKLLCMAGKQNNSGVFMLNDRIAYTDEMLSTIFRRPLNTIRLALQTFEKFGMIEIIDHVITIPNWGKHQNLDQLENKKNYMKNYMKNYREKQVSLTCKTNSKTNGKTNGKTNSKTNVSQADKDIDKEEDKEKEEDIDKDIFVSDETKSSHKKNVRHKHGDYDNVLLSDEEYEKLKVEFPEDYQDRIERLSEYMASTGKTYKNHLATIRCWAKKEQPKTTSTQSVKQPQSEYDRFMSNLQEIYNESE